jgi:quinol monooxygenase YgiN
VIPDGNGGASVYVRFYATALDPSDLADVRRIFAEDIKPVFEALPGCHSMELLISTSTSAGGLVDGAAISRWESLQDLSSGLESRAVAESMVRLLPFLRLEPVIKIFEILE